MVEVKINLIWSQIMKTVNDNPYEFFKDGGWTVLIEGGDSDAVRRGHIVLIKLTLNDNFMQSGADSDSESEFEADPAELEQSSSSDSASSFNDSDGSDGDSGSGSDFGGEEDESEGEDWDELERKAANGESRHVWMFGGLLTPSCLKPIRGRPKRMGAIPIRTRIDQKRVKGKPSLKRSQGRSRYSVRTTIRLAGRTQT
jgi:hypothetical protein